MPNPSLAEYLVEVSVREAVEALLAVHVDDPIPEFEDFGDGIRARRARLESSGFLDGPQDADRFGQRPIVRGQDDRCRNDSNVGSGGLIEKVERIAQNCIDPVGFFNYSAQNAVRGEVIVLISDKND